jgi:hypothetical protein
MSVPVSKWKWFGTVAHHICGRWCRFHLATKVGKYLVSTVGEYVHPCRSGGSEAREAAWLRDYPKGEEISPGLHYETMVFLAGRPCDPISCDCGMPAPKGDELDSAGYRTRGEAGRGHMKLCRKWARKTSLM